MVPYSFGFMCVFKRTLKIWLLFIWKDGLIPQIKHWVKLLLLSGWLAVPYFLKVSCSKEDIMFHSTRIKHFVNTQTMSYDFFCFYLFIYGTENAGMRITKKMSITIWKLISGTEECLLHITRPGWQAGFKRNFVVLSVFHTLNLNPI